MPRDETKPPDEPTSSEQPTASEPNQRAQPPAALPRGTRIGSYQIIKLIGQGGMGSVYLAEQEHPHRKVALKLIRPGVVGAQALRRFEHESEILGRLKHPGIAQIYDAGLHEGAPFFAMEYIEGEPLTTYAAQKKLGTRDRLRLLAKVCEAVHHAHTKGVIHRDLKPGNILVTEVGEPPEPQPKILDFGVARATDSDLQTITLQTDIGQLLGTIPYMSPEQVAGDPHELDTRSDVYALGVVLYELLAGRLPYDLKNRMIHEAARVIREDDPTRLSSINTKLRGDIETIVGMALEKDKERRYQSALDLGSDIRRYLADEPIAARPPSTWYQLSKFSRRNRALVVGVAAVFVVLVLGLAGTSYGLTKANTQSQLASERADEATAAKQTAEDQRDLADAARFEADTARAEETKRAEELQLVANFQAERLGDIDPDGMGLTLRYGLRDKLAALADRRGLDEAETAALLEGYDSLVSGADFTGLALETLDEHIFEPALEAIDRQFADQPLVKARLLQTMADTMRDAGLLDNATLPQTEALDIRRAQLGDDHPDTLTSISDMGTLLQSQGRLDDAEPYFREALDAHRRVLGDDHPDTLMSIGNMGALLQVQGRHDDAEPYYREALDAYRRVLGDDHPNTLTSINNMASLLHAQGRLDDAEPLFREALDAKRRVLGDDHPSTLISINRMGGLLHDQGRHDDAEPYYREALDATRRVLGDDHPNTLMSIGNMGAFLQVQGRLDDAEPYYREALDAKRRVLGDDHPSTLTSISNMGSLLQAQGRLDDAEPYLREALNARRRDLGDDHPSTLSSISNMGSLLRELDRLAEAQTLGAEAVERGRATLGPEHWLVGVFLSQHARTFLALENYAQAEALALEAHMILSAALGDDHQRTTGAVNRLVELYTAWHEAEPDTGHDAKADEWQARLVPIE